MRLVSYSLRVAPQMVRPGVLVTHGDASHRAIVVLDCIRVLEYRHGHVAPRRASMRELLAAGPAILDDLRAAVSWAARQGMAELQATDPPLAYDWSLVKFQPPEPNPSSVRLVRGCFGVRASGQSGRGEPAGERREIRYVYGNPTSLIGPDAVVDAPDTAQLDFEPSLALFVGTAGRNITPEAAWGHLAGIAIANQWVARDLERNETAAQWGPGPSRDFAIAVGPWMVTTDELKEAVVDGQVCLEMRAKLNDVEIGGTEGAAWSVAEVLAEASRTVDLQPGDTIILCGALSLAESPHGTPGRWLQPGDCVEVTVEHLGWLRNWVGFRPEY